MRHQPPSFAIPLGPLPIGVTQEDIFMAYFTIDDTKRLPSPAEWFSVLCGTTEAVTTIASGTLHTNDPVPPGFFGNDTYHATEKYETTQCEGWFVRYSSVQYEFLAGREDINHPECIAVQGPNKPFAVFASRYNQLQNRIVLKFIGPTDLCHQKQEQLSTLFSQPVELKK